MAIAALPRPVDAAPFRAHVRHVLEVSGVTAEALGVIAGVAPATIRRLIGERADPTPARIAPDVARRLLAVTAAELAELSERHVAADAASRQLRLLHAQGWTTSRMAEEFGLEHWLAEALLDRAVATCSRLVDAQLRGGMLALRSGPARAAA